MINQSYLIKPIKGHEGYFVSTDGEVFTQWVNKGIHGLVLEEPLMKMKCSKVSKQGHLGVRLGGRDGKWNLVHRLVYATFRQEIKPNLVVRHLNDIPDDNRLENLEVGTQKDNMQDCKVNGNLNPRKKLTPEAVRRIRSIKENDPKKPNREIAELFGVSRRLIDMVVKNEIWRGA